MSNRSIAISLTIVFLSLVSLILGVGELGLHSMNQLDFEARDIAARQWRDVQLSDEALNYSNRNSHINFQMFLDEDSPLDSLIAERKGNSARITDLFAILQTRVDSPQEQYCLDAVLTSRKLYTASYESASSLLLSGKKVEARRFQVHHTLPLLLSYHSALRKYADFQTREMSEQLAISSSRYRKSHKEVLAMMTFSVLLSLALAAFVIRTIAVEINRREQAETSLRKLNADLEIKVLVRTASLEESNRSLSSEIAERKRTEALVRRLSMAVEQSPASVIITDLAGRIVYVNQKFIESTGYSRGELIGQNPRILKSGHTQPEDYQRLWQTITAGKEWRGEFCNRKKNGELFWQHALICPIREENSTISHFLALIEDITARRQAEKDLLLTRFSVETASDSVFWVDPQGRILYANESACRSLGRSSEELTSLSIPDIDPQFPPEKWKEFWAQLKTQHSMAFETQQQNRKGRIFPIEVSANYLEFDGQEYLFAFTHDISERRAIQAQLQQSLKMESVGHLAAGVAHEINTPTQFVTDNLTFLRDACKSTSELIDLYRRTMDDHSSALPSGLIAAIHAGERVCDLDFILQEVPRAIGQSLDGAHRIAEIVRAMKLFSHPDSVEKTETDLNQAIESTITVARSEWKYVAEVVTDLDPALPPVLCYPGDINQVVLNVLVNAAHAIEEKTEHTATDKVIANSERRTTNDDPQAKGENENQATAHAMGRIDVRTRKRDNLVEISITDTGAGIPEDIRSKIFDPFFTTKDVGAGTGQGLAIAYGLIVKKHSGKIWFETNLGTGTTFFISLPIASEPNVSEHTAESNATEQHNFTVSS